MRHPFRRKTLRARLWPVYALGLLLFWLARPTPVGFTCGVLLIAAGEMLRVWGAGHLVKNDVLTLTGPYAHVRNPLYAGTLLIGLGFALAAGGLAGWIVLPVGIALFFAYYFPYKERIESARLERFYGTPYTLYRAAVPALVPAFTAWRPAPGAAGSHETSWSAVRFAENDESGTLLAVVVGVIALALRPLLSVG
jgi:protein-S-isoprenylcysteine O-methyltransferase Ste14